MSDRKPPGTEFSSWVERRIHEASEQGAFEDLPGTGESIEDLDRPHDDNWWVKRKLRSENLSYLPPALLLRKHVEDARTALDQATSEREVREIVTAINAEIRRALRTPVSGLQPDASMLDVEDEVRSWQRRR